MAGFRVTSRGLAEIAKASIAQLPRSAGVKTSLAAPTVGGQAVLSYETIYPEDTTWAGGADATTTDATAAFRAISDYIIAHPAAYRIKLGPSYNLNSAPVTTHGGNSIWYLPNFGDGASVIELECAPGGTTLTTTQTGLTYSAPNGVPSVLGGPTGEQLGVNAHFSTAYVKILGTLTVVTPANPTIAGVNLERIANVGGGGRIVATTTNPTAAAPTNNWAFGVRLPDGDNAGRVVLSEVEATGYMAGVIAGPHADIAQTFAHFCVGGFCVSGNTQYSGNDGHSIQPLRLLTQECVNHIAGWSPTSGIISLPNGKGGQLDLKWDIEDGAAAQWFTTVNHVLDANNVLFGELRYNRVVGGTGVTAGALTTSGGQFLNFTDIASSNGARYGRLTLRQLITAVGNSFGVDSAATVNAGYEILTASALRWRLRKNTTAESGSNNGGDLELVAYDDAGTSLIFTALTVLRKSSRFVFGGTLQFKRRTYTTTNTLSTNDHIVAAVDTSTTPTYTLPSCASHGGCLWIVDESNGAGSHTLTITCAGGDTFWDATTSKTITVNGGSLLLYSNTGTKWMLLARGLGT